MGMQKCSIRTLVIVTTLLAPGGTLWAQDAQPVDDGHGHVNEPGMAYPDAAVEFPQAPATVTVMGHEVLPKKGIYDVTTDLNVRSGPGTKFSRIKGLKSGTRVRAVGKTEDGDWMAISVDGVTLGYAYAPLLVAVVDGALAEQFTGSYMSEQVGDGIACDYRFRFERKSDVQGGSFETADYEVRFRCASQKGAALFYGHMFLTEAPVHERKGLHLISLDVRSIGDGMEEFLTSNFLYNPKTGQMTFDGHTLPRFALPPKVQKYQTTSVKDALQQALEASIACWTEEAWATLFSSAEAKPE